MAFAGHLARSKSAKSNLNLAFPHDPNHSPVSPSMPSAIEMINDGNHPMCNKLAQFDSTAISQETLEAQRLQGILRRAKELTANPDSTEEWVKWLQNYSKVCHNPFSCLTCPDPFLWSERRNVWKLRPTCWF